MSKAANRATRPRVTSARTHQDDHEEVEMNDKLLTEEEILAQIEKVKEK